MKVKITGHSDSDVAPWWYAKHIGEIFDVAEDEVMTQYYLTAIEGSSHLRHIKKVDCEVVA